MASFSKPPLSYLQESLLKGYVGVHFEQGVPVLDRDLNLYSDLLAASSRQVLAAFVGDGVPAGGSFDLDQSAPWVPARESSYSIRVPALVTDGSIGVGNASAIDDGASTKIIESSGTWNDFFILSGTCLVEGIVFENPALIRYSEQTPAPPPLTGAEPSFDGSVERHDLVYLDAWLDEVGGAEERALLNQNDVGMETSVRQRAIWTVRVAEGAPLPATPAGHTYVLLAEIVRPRQLPVAALTPDMIRDLRVARLTLADAEHRVKSIEPSFSTWLEGGVVMSDFVQPIKMPFLEREYTRQYQVYVRLQGGNFFSASNGVVIDGIPATILNSGSALRVIDFLIPLNLMVGWHDVTFSQTTPVTPATPLGSVTLKTSVYVPEEWARYPGFAHDVGVGPSGEVWKIDTEGSEDSSYVYSGGYKVYQWLEAGDVYNSQWMTPPLLYAMRVAVGPGGVPWTVNLVSGSRLISYLPASSSSWVYVPEQAHDIAVGADGSVWKVGIIDADGGFIVSKYDHDSGIWTPNAMQVGGLRIAVDPAGDPWIVDDNYKIRHLPNSSTNGTWIDLPGEGRDIGVGADGSVWIISNTPGPGGYVAMKLGPDFGDGPSWEPSNGAGVAISVGPDGQPWIIDSTQVLRRRVRW